MIILTVACPGCGEERNIYNGEARLAPFGVEMSILIADFIDSCQCNSQKQQIAR